MEMIINLVILGVIIICAWSGYKKGIIMGIGGVLAIIIAIYGANLLANTFSHEIIPVLRPFANGFMESRISVEDGVMERMDWDKTSYALHDLLEMYPERQEEFCRECYLTLGLDDTAAANMAARAMDFAEKNNEKLLDSVVQILCETVSYFGCFVLAFLLLLIILTVIGNLPNLSFKIPHMDVVNDIFGTLIGAATGIAFGMIIVWALRFAGIIIGSNTLADGWLTGWLLEHNLLTTYLGL